jgi:hypothetical protein
MGGHCTDSGRNHEGTRSDTVLPGPALDTSCADSFSVFQPVPDPVQAWDRRVRPPPKVETPIHDNIRELVTWECKEHGVTIIMNVLANPTGSVGRWNLNFWRLEQFNTSF